MLILKSLASRISKEVISLIFSIIKIFFAPPPAMIIFFGFLGNNYREILRDFAMISIKVASASSRDKPSNIIK